MGDDEGTEVVALQDAADILKVHYMTAYRWVRAGDLPAFKAGGRLRVHREDLDRFIASRTVDVAAPAGGDRRTDWPLHIDRLHAAFSQGASAEATAMVRKVIADGASAADVYVKLITAVLHRIGDDWEHGRLNVAEEHRATQMAIALLGRLGEHFRRRGPSRGRVITMTPAGEGHGLATIMVGDLLRGGGFEVHQLGPDVPVADLVMLMAIVNPSAVCVSVTRTDLPREVLGELVEAVDRSEGTRCVLGGQGVDPELARDLGAEHVADIRALAGELAAG